MLKLNKIGVVITGAPSNVTEATQIYFHLNNFYKLCIPPDEIGIITPYDKQVQLIKKLLNDHQLSYI